MTEEDAPDEFVPVAFCSEKNIQKQFGGMARRSIIYNVVMEEKPYHYICLSQMYEDISRVLHFVPFLGARNSRNAYIMKYNVDASWVILYKWDHSKTCWRKMDA
jgi:hypothetical protein